MNELEREKICVHETSNYGPKSCRMGLLFSASLRLSRYLWIGFNGTTRHDSVFMHSTRVERLLALPRVSLQDRRGSMGDRSTTLQIWMEYNLCTIV